ncbi:nitrous oxide reductase accessory protein NosL [Fulvivirgaceae bacterium BMA10]|uniref:Nitrous oxide reductase accessory protein NosL n=1 Tax=Splendidivirga corallicola TaxID=3051826 RepID=A0ABT8KW70_9BACT|nr:nitrous oxide reductase accessory protein NosL [Fulvivirgaceae bacterium BMA10]
MKKLARICMLVAVLMPLLLFVFPLWKITLSAPQYPDGISMYIWINKITGDTEYTLQNINILNHYVGMQYIVPDSIPELKYFPFIVISTVIIGLIFFFVNNRKLFVTWGVMMILLGALGIYDFYLWEYDYGHNLDPNAPIKVPGMAYQPPVFGSKMLLNFKADSYPDLGGIFLGVGIALSFAAFWMAGRKQRDGKVKPFDEHHTKEKIIAAVTFIAILSSCTPKQEPIVYGQDACKFCKMTIVDNRYGSELVTTKGKVYKFDAIECMINFKKAELQDSEIHDALVTTYTLPGKLVSARDVWYLRSKELPSPMGMFLNAFENKEEALKFQQDHPGEIFSWVDLKDRFEQLSSLQDP